jgi:Fe-S-cluster containining protein
VNYVLPKDFQGYKAGTELRDVTIEEARAMECNLCGDCCNGMRPDVKKDEDTGLPLFTWGGEFPEDLYEERYGQKMLLPIIPLEEIKETPYQGDIGIGESFATDADDKPYTCFKCSFLEEHEDGTGTCGLINKFGDGDPNKLETIRPRACGEFPVYGNNVGDAIIGGKTFIPPTGALPRCTWYAIRVTGPYKDTEYWRERWDKQQRGEEVEDLHIPQEFIDSVRSKREFS